MSIPTWIGLCSQSELQCLSNLANDYALSHSLILRPKLRSTTSPKAADPAPFTLFPTHFPKELFERVQRVQEAYNILYANIAVNQDFLKKVIGSAVIRVDDFQRGLWEVYERVEREGVRQPLQLGLFRSDYMLHAPNEIDVTIKQVEFNTISASFGPLANRVSDLHSYLHRSGAYPARLGMTSDHLPKNTALKDLVKGLVDAHKAYGKENAAILFVVQEGERNAFDQRALEWELLDNYNVKVVRRTFHQLSTQVTFAPHTFALLLNSPQSPASSPSTFNGKPEVFPPPPAQEISVVYYRAGYGPSDYPSSVEWKTRYLLERSLAIKCPSIALQIAGAKKIQQVLTEPGILEKFLGDGSLNADRLNGIDAETGANVQVKSSLTTEDLASLRETFTNLYPLDDSALGQKALALAYTQFSQFVLKPQREGGGNNIYRDKIPGFLDRLAKGEEEGFRGGEKRRRLSGDSQSPDRSRSSRRNSLLSGARLEEDLNQPTPKARESYILMDLIQSPKGIKNYLMRANDIDEEIQETDVVNELGIYGVCLFKKNSNGKAEILVNRRAGHLLRTKGREADEGGIAVGYSVIDSPYCY